MTNPHDYSDNLSPDDRRLVDALVEGGFDRSALEALSASDRRRTNAIASLFELLDDYPVEDADETLVHATLARVDRYEDQRAARMAFDNAPAMADNQPRGRLWRMPDFISVAAVILIGVSMIWPMTSHIRNRSIDAGCASNMRMLGIGLGQYANDYNDAMPMAMANFGPDVSWDKIHNVVNMRPLMDGGYCELGHMRCPGHDQVGDSYSYRWQLPEQPATWGVHQVTIVLGDRNPVIDAARMGQVIPALSISLNHGGRGQNTLSNDGSTLWLEQPVMGVNDNIWLPSGVTFLRSGDRPTDPSDIFLAH